SPPRQLAVSSRTLPRKRWLRSSATGRSPRSTTFTHDSRLSCWVAQPPSTSTVPRRSDRISLRMVDLQESLALQAEGQQVKGPKGLRARQLEAAKLGKAIH